MRFVEIFDNRHRLDQRLPIHIEGRYQPLRVDREILGLPLVATRQMDGPVLMGKALEVEGDPHAKRRR